MITKENIGNETFESMTINDTPALFTDMRIDRNAVPEGLYAYDIRESDDGDRLATIEPTVMVNHGGTILTRKEFIKDMDIKELTERYQDRFDAHYLQDDNGTGRKGRKRKKEVETPNFLKDVIRPILDTLPDLLPEYGFTKTTDDYAMYGEYYRIKAGIVLVGGFSIDEDFNLYFTPLFHGKACGKSHKIDSIGQLVEIIREQFERREVKMKG